MKLTPLGRVLMFAGTRLEANPSGNPNLTWDAIFEGYVLVDPTI